MDNYLMVGIFLFFVLLIIGRAVSEKSLKLLSDDDKVKLLDTFTGYRKYYIVPILIILVSYFLLRRFYPQITNVLMLGSLAALSIYALSINVLVYKKMKDTGISVSYLKKFMIARSLSFVGLICLVVALVLKKLQ